MNNASPGVQDGQGSLMTIGEEKTEPPIRRFPEVSRGLPSIKISLSSPSSRRPINLLTRILHDPSMENLVALNGHLLRQRHKQHVQLPEIEHHQTFQEEVLHSLIPSGIKPPDQADERVLHSGVVDHVHARAGNNDDDEEEDSEDEDDIYIDEEQKSHVPALVRTLSAPLLSLDSSDDDTDDDDVSSKEGEEKEATATTTVHNVTLSETVNRTNDEFALSNDGSLVTRLRSSSTADLPQYHDHLRRAGPSLLSTLFQYEPLNDDVLLETKSLEEARRLFDILTRHCRTKVRAPPAVQPVIPVSTGEQEPSSENSRIQAVDDLKIIVPNRHSTSIQGRRHSDAVSPFSFRLENEEEHIDHILHDKAFVAFKIFVHLTIFDPFFQDAVEEKTLSSMRRLHLHRHMLEGDEEHRLLTAKFISFVSSNIIRFAQWKRIVKPKAHALVMQYMRLPDPLLDPYLVNVRLSSDLRLPPSGLYYDVGAEEVCRIFATHPSTGLAHTEIARRREKYGVNALPKPKRPSIILMFLRQILDFMVLILIVASIVSAIMTDWEAAVVLMLVVVFNVILGFLQEFRAERAMAALMKMNVPFARVMRQGQVESIRAEDLVPGDIVLLEEGDQVTADLRLVEEVDLYVIEALLTGESDPVEKAVPAIFKRNVSVGDRRNLCFMGTLVTKGRGKGVVVATGKKTEIGKIQKNISQSKSRPSVLQRRLKILGIALVAFAIVACAIIAIVGIIYGKDWLTMVKVATSIAVSAIPEGLVAILTVAAAAGTQNMAKKRAIVRRVNAVESLGSITVICSDKTGTLTEGKMKTSDIVIGNAHFVVNSSSASEFEGSISLVTPDIEAADTKGKEVHISSDDVPPLLAKMMMSMALCNNSTIQEVSASNDCSTEKQQNEKKSKKGHSTTPLTTELQNREPQDEAIEIEMVTIKNEKDKTDGQLETFGDPTEVALQLAAHYIKLSKNDWLDSKGCEFLNEFAFDSDRKRMTVVYKLPDEHCPFHVQVNEQTEKEGEVGEQVQQQDEVRGNVSNWALAKGATESITSICSFAQIDDDTIVPMTPDYATALERKSLSMATNGLRVLAFAYKPISADDTKPTFYNLETHEHESRVEQIDFMENDLIFLGFAGMIDPPREGVRESVAECRGAGIRVIMITGDHQKTAQTIGDDLGLFPSDAQTAEQKAQLVMKGDQIDELVATGKLDSLEPFPVVFARVSPENKMQIVESLQKRGEVTAMVGDGVNDAASIRRADVGVAMGLSGTDLAKQAAAVVLANDRFTTIVEAIREGRRTYDNIRKFIMYLLSCNLAEILLTLICVVSNRPVPFTSMMILYANLIADTPPALALGFEPADRGIMKRLPRNPKGGIFTMFGWMMLLVQGTLMTGISLAAFLIAIYVEKYELLHAQAYTWALLTTVQLMHSFHSRSNVQSIFLKNPISNPLIIVGVLISFVCVFAGLYIPGFNKMLNLMELSWWDWAKVAIAVAVHFVAMELAKLIIVVKNLAHKGIAKRRKSKERFYSEL